MLAATGQVLKQKQKLILLRLLVLCQKKISPKLMFSRQDAWTDRCTDS